MNRTPALLVLAFAFALGCGGSSKSADTTTTPAGGDTAAPAPAQAVERDRAHLTDGFRYVTGDTFALVAFDVQRLRGTPIYDAVAAAVLQDPQVSATVNELAQAVGLDLRTDLRGVTVFLPQTLLEGGDDMLLIFEAPFDDPARLMDFIRTKSGDDIQPVTAEGETQWTIDGEARIAFRGDMAVVGTLGMFDDALASAATGQPTGALAGLLAEVDAGKHAFMVAALPQPLRDSLRTMAPQAGDIQTVIATADATAGLALRVKATVASAESATTLATMLQQLTQQVSSDPSLGQMGLSQPLQDARIAAEGTALTIEIDLPESAVQQILAMLGAMAG